MPSTLVPNCSLSYTKDLNELILTFNPIEICNSGITEIGLNISLNGGVTSIYSDNNLYSTKMHFTTSLGGTITSTANSITIIGTSTSFLTDINVGDVISFHSLFYIVSEIVSDTILYLNTVASSSNINTSYSIFRPIIKYSLSDLGITTILPNGLYTVTLVSQILSLPTQTYDFTLYVYANSINCVQSKLMDLASKCNNCPDIEEIKYTLLLKALLDALDIAVENNNTSTITMITDKIDRYCLLLDTNCSTC